MKFRLTMCLCIVLAALCGVAAAAEYFVGKTGDDGNDGRSRGTAFATIQKGVDALEPGDTLTILPGEYLGSVRRQGLGKEGVVTTIRAEIPGTAVLRGDVPLPAGATVTGWVNLPLRSSAFHGAPKL